MVPFTHVLGQVPTASASTRSEAPVLAEQAGLRGTAGCVFRHLHACACCVPFPPFPPPPVSRLKHTSVPATARLRRSLSAAVSPSRQCSADGTCGPAFYVMWT